MAPTDRSADDLNPRFHHLRSGNWLVQKADANILIFHNMITRQEKILNLFSGNSHLFPKDQHIGFLLLNCSFPLMEKNQKVKSFESPTNCDYVLLPARNPSRSALGSFGLALILIASLVDCSSCLRTLSHSKPTIQGSTLS